MGFDLRRRTVCLAAGATAVLASGALAAQSTAAQITLNATCYLNTDRSTAKVTITGRGFAPSSSVDIGGGVFGTAKTDVAGEFLTKVAAPHSTIKPGARKFKVTASTENFDTGQKTSAQTFGFYSVAGVGFSDNFVGFGKRITYYFGGFRPGEQIYGHYFIGKREAGRKRFGKATGPCGTLKAKATGYPISSAHPDKWTVYFDNLKRFAKKAIPTYVYAFHKV
jgi:hypothetical protein